MGKIESLKEKRVLITGASRGIGYALAQAFAQRKTHLELVARQFPINFESKLQQLGALSVHLYRADLSQTAEVDQLHKEIVNANKTPDILLNNAGLLTGGLLENQNPDDIETMIKVNVLALIRLSRLFLPHMLERKSGWIVNNSSVSGKMFFPCASTYAASKAAVVAFTESLKQELIGTGVTSLLLVTPGVKTEMYDDISNLYGSHLDISALSSIPASEWAERVIDAIQRRKSILHSRGTTRIGVFTAQHFPNLFESMVRSRFSRTPRRP